MQRTISIERLYFLGNFKNIKISTTLTDIPEDWAKDLKVVDGLFREQLISVEKAYCQYHELVKGLPADEAETFEYLEAERTKTIEELKEEIALITTPPAGAVNTK
jgi:hypothetical protein